MKRVSIPALLSLLMFAGAASADILPDGHKGVKLSIKVDAEVPKDRILILAHTFRVLDIVQPGQVQEVEWHPMAGKMTLMTVPVTKIDDKVDERRKKQDNEPLKEIEKSGTACHEGFDGVRTVPESAPADEVRWNYKVTFTDTGCTATLEKMEFFDKAGKPVAGTDVPGVPGAPSAAPSGSAAPSSSAAPASSAAAPGADKGGCGCELAPGLPASTGGAGLFAMLGLALASLRRRRDRTS
ncbi:MAG: MYXO-CTERM sorting domain-containing protein [Polyangiaceae bacterium]